MRVGTLTVIDVYSQDKLVGKGYIIHELEYVHRPTIYDFEGNELPSGPYRIKFGETFPVVITDWIH